MKVGSCLQTNVRNVSNSRLKYSHKLSCYSNFPGFDVVSKSNHVIGVDKSDLIITRPKPPVGFNLLSFTGNSLKNLGQIASIAPEYQGIMDKVYKVGGLGNVAGEAAVAFHDHGDLDIRTFVPYYSPGNSTGKIKVRTPLFDDFGHRLYWDKPVFENDKIVLNADGTPKTVSEPAFTFKSVGIDYRLDDKLGEQFVIHQEPPKGKEWNTGYKVLEDIGISGEVQAVTEDLAATKPVSYKVFQVKGTGVDVKGNPPVYIIHTPDLAAFSKAYGGEAYAGKAFDDYFYSIFSKAAVDAIPKLNDKKFGNFNPGNFWLHDRQAFPAMMEIAERSSKGDEYWRGIRTHASFHNPGRAYQGHYQNPIDFYRIVGSNDDAIQLSKNPADLEFAQIMLAKIEAVRKDPNDERFSPEQILTKDELERLNAIFDPLYGQYKDEFGEYNLCKIPVEGVRKNPFNTTAGTVSSYYGKEMKDPNTREIAYGLTSDFASIPTVDIVNGSSAKNLHLDEVGDFGTNNGFTAKVKEGFTPLTADIVADKDKFFAAKQSNKKWLMDTIAANSESQDTLAKLFFDETAIAKGSEVYGSLGEYKDGDVLFIGWGRPDSQKGFPTTLEGFLDFFKNPNISAETKSHTKLLLGAGVWEDNPPDWQTITKQLEELQTLDNGAYKNNVCYLNGFFSNRIVACADFTNITSRYEPCGITPLESYAAGTPVLSNNTGGSPDFIKPIVKGEAITNQTGFLTKHAYLVNPEVVGAKPGLTAIQLDEARRQALGKENAECIQQAMELFTGDPEGYKTVMMNAANSKIDWHENGEFNGGLSALQRYMQQAWHIGADKQELSGETRNISPFVNMKGKIFKNKMSIQSKMDIPSGLKTAKKEGLFENTLNSIKNSGKSFYAALGAVAIVSGVVYVINRLINKAE